MILEKCPCLNIAENCKQLPHNAKRGATAAQFSLCVHHATPEFHGSQIRPRQIILFDGLFHGMQQGLLFIFLGKGKGKLMENNYISGF